MNYQSPVLNKTITPYNSPNDIVSGLPDLSTDFRPYLQSKFPDKSFNETTSVSIDISNTNPFFKKLKLTQHYEKSNQSTPYSHRRTCSNEVPQSMVSVCREKPNTKPFFNEQGDSYQQSQLMIPLAKESQKSHNNDFNMRRKTTPDIVYESVKEDDDQYCSEEISIPPEYQNQKPRERDSSNDSGEGLKFDSLIEEMNYWNSKIMPGNYMPGNDKVKTPSVSNNSQQPSDREVSDSFIIKEDKSQESIRSLGIFNKSSVTAREEEHELPPPSFTEPSIPSMTPISPRLYKPSYLNELQDQYNDHPQIQQEISKANMLTKQYRAMMMFVENSKEPTTEQETKEQLEVQQKERDLSNQLISCMDRIKVMTDQLDMKCPLDDDESKQIEYSTSQLQAKFNALTDEVLKAKFIKFLTEYDMNQQEEIEEEVPNADEEIFDSLLPDTDRLEKVNESLEKYNSNTERRIEETQRMIEEMKSITDRKRSITDR